MTGPCDCVSCAIDRVRVRLLAAAGVKPYIFWNSDPFSWSFETCRRYRADYQSGLDLDLLAHQLQISTKPFSGGKEMRVPIQFSDPKP